MPARALRLAFMVAWLAVQALLIATASGRVKHACGFRMFEESAVLTLHLDRVVAGAIVPMHNDWQVHDCRGRLHRYRWPALVPAGPYFLDAPIGSPYGVDARLAQMRAAIAWVAAHTPDDCETRGFLATVRATRNGRALPPVTFRVDR